MESPLFSEEAADKEVIKSLFKEIERLKKHPMGKIIKSVDGKYYRVHSYEELDEGAFDAYFEHAKQEVADLEAIAPAPAVPSDTSAPAEDQQLPVPEPVAAPAPAALAPDPDAAAAVPAPPEQPAPVTLT